MKILLVQDRLRSGGTERQTLTLAKAFSQSGHLAKVLVFRPGGALFEDASDVLLDALQPFDLGLDWFAPGLINRIREFGPDVVLTMGRMANCYGGMIQRRIPSAVVVGTLRTGKPLPLLYRRSLRIVRAVVANSRQAADRLRKEAGLAESRVRTIHNALVFSPQLRLQAGAPEAGIRERLGAGIDTTIFLCVAMFRREKNQRSLIAAAAQLPRDDDWQLWFIGSGETERNCVEFVAGTGMADRIRFLGFQKDPTPYYRAADVAVLTSEAESLSNFLIEAQAHGLPALAYDVQGVRECFRDGETGRALPYGDEAGLATEMGRLLHDRALREQMSAAARLHARENFSSEQQSRQYLDLFEQLVSKR